MTIKTNTNTFKDFFEKEKIRKYVLKDVLWKIIFYKMPLALAVTIFDPIGWRIVLAVGVLFVFYSLMYFIMNIIELKN